MDSELDRPSNKTAWEDADPLLVPGAFQTNLEEALAETGGELLAIDCVEYPCVAALHVPSEFGALPNALEGTEGLHVLRAFLDEAGYVDFQFGFARVVNAPDGYTCVVALAAPNDELGELNVRERALELSRSLPADHPTEGQNSTSGR